MVSRCAFVLIYLAALLAGEVSNAHPDVELRLEHATAAIDASPDDATAHLKRARIQAGRGDFAAAWSDLAEAQRLVGASSEVDMAVVDVALASGDTVRGRRALRRLAASQPDAPAYLFRLARFNAVRGNHTAAAEALGRALDRSDGHVEPDHIVWLAGLWLDAGAPEEALAALEFGTARLGELVVFVNLGVAVEMDLGRPERALTRMRALPPALAAHPRWLLRKADAQRAAGLPGAADATLSRARVAVLGGRARGDAARLLAEIDASLAR